MSEPLLSDAELSERIANFIEPKPKEWQLDAPYLNHVAWAYAERQWHPRDMVNDPAMTVMLLTHPKTRFRMTKYSDGWYIAARVGIGLIEETDWMVHQVQPEQFGRAVAEAFAKANGIAQ